MPTKPIVGLHHVTAITGEPQRNLDFYTDVLGLRFVKKTVNFDDPGVQSVDIECSLRKRRNTTEPFLCTARPNSDTLPLLPMIALIRIGE